MFGVTPLLRRGFCLKSSGHSTFTNINAATHVIASRWSALPETAHARVSSLSLSSGSARKGCSPGVLGFSPYADGILILNDKPASVQQALGPILVKTPPFVCGSLLLRFVTVRC